MRQHSFSTKLYTLMSLLLTAMVVVGAIGIVGIGRTNTGLETVYKDRVIPLKQLKQIADAYAVSVIDAANKANAGIFTAEETLKAVTSARDTIRENWKAYRATSLTPEEARLAQEAEQLFGPADQGVEQVISRLSGRTGNLKDSFGDFDGPLYTSVDPISNKITELVDLQLRVAEAEYQAAQQRFTAVRLLSIGSVLVSLIAGGMFGWLLVRSLVGTLRRTTVQLREGAEQVVAASSQVATAAQSLSQGASEQAASLEETSASMEEIASVTARTAENSASAAGLMDEVDGRVRESNRTLEEMVASMTSIQESSQKVSKIIRTIDEIAFQTNILALNAAVEAARAGEAGMGFAVVADEVRNLAQRAAQAAKDTAGLIEESIARAQGGTTKVGEVASAIRSITESVSTVKGLVEEVSSATRQQAQGVGQVSQAVSQMEKVTQTTAATAEESAAASEELNAQAETSMVVVSELARLVEGQGRFATGARPVRPTGSLNLVRGRTRSSAA